MFSANEPPNILVTLIRDPELIDGHGLRMFANVLKNGEVYGAISAEEPHLSEVLIRIHHHIIGNSAFGFTCLELLEKFFPDFEWKVVIIPEKLGHESHQRALEKVISTVDYFWSHDGMRRMDMDTVVTARLKEGDRLFPEGAMFGSATLNEMSDAGKRWQEYSEVLALLGAVFFELPEPEKESGHD